MIARVRHPNVVRIFDLGVADDHAYIAMEYLGAGSLAERLNWALDPELSVDYATQVGGALAAIHEAGILHRDLKPANIMFREDGSARADRLRAREADAAARRDHGNGPDFRHALLHEPGAGSRRADRRALAISTAWGACCSRC